MTTPHPTPEPAPLPTLVPAGGLLWAYVIERDGGDHYVGVIAGWAATVDPVSGNPEWRPVVAPASRGPAAAEVVPHNAAVFLTDTLADARALANLGAE